MTSKNKKNNVVSLPIVDSNAALKETCESIRSLLVRAEQSDLPLRYKVAMKVKEVRDESRFGEKSVEQVARRLGYSAANLYDYAKVADAWSEAEFKKHAERRTKKGSGLSFSHFLELAEVKEPAERAMLLESCFHEAWSVRALKKNKPSTAPAAAEPAPSQPRLVESAEARRQPHGLASSSSAMVKQLEADLASLDDRDEVSAEEAEVVRNNCSALAALIVKLEQRLGKASGVAVASMAAE